MLGLDEGRLTKVYLLVNVNYEPIDAVYHSSLDENEES
jgi:hypothetical protein